MLDPLYNVNLHIGDILYLADPYSSFYICLKDSATFLPHPTLFTRFLPVAEGAWVPEVHIYS